MGMQTTGYRTQKGGVSLDLMGWDKRSGAALYRFGNGFVPFWGRFVPDLGHLLQACAGLSAGGGMM
jgi:hypothetical protein